MKRRDFIKKAGVAATAGAFSPLMFANAQASTFSFDMVTSWPTALDTIYGGAINTARLIEELTDGDVTIEVHPAGAIVGGLEVYDAVSSGAVTMGHTASYYYVGKDPAHGFFSCLPFGLNAQQQNAWLETGGGQELWNELNAPDNLIAFAAGNTGVQMGGWFNKEINTPEDLQGLTMRIPGLGGQVMDLAGANVQNIPGGEIYLALERGAIDATEWVGPYDDEILGFNEIAQYYYAPGWHEPGPTLGTYINLAEYNELPEDVQQAIQTASKAANLQMLADYDAKNGAALTRILEGGNVELRTFPPEVLSALEGFANTLYEESAASSAQFGAIYPQWTAFRDEIRSFHRISEKAWLDYTIPAEES